MNIKTLLGQLRLLAIIEGISYISFGLTMPLKYVWGIKEPNMIVGMAHGGLFIAYCAWVCVNHIDRKWDVKKTSVLLISSLVPFMTFWADKHYLKNEEN